MENSFAAQVVSNANKQLLAIRKTMFWIVEKLLSYVLLPT